MAATDGFGKPFHLHNSKAVQTSKRAEPHVSDATETGEQTDENNNNNYYYYSVTTRCPSL